MKYVAAYLLAQLAGKESPSAADVKAILAGAAARSLNPNIWWKLDDD